VKVGVLALQGDVREHAAVLEALGSDPVEIRTPADLAGVDALVLPGGESTTLSLLLESSGLGGAVEEMIGGGTAVFGTCAGLILLSAEVLDGRADQHCMGAIDLSVRRNAYGRQPESFECDLTVRGVPGGSVPGVFIRAPVVERFGPRVEVLATVDAPGRPASPALLRQDRVLVSAFHPELSGDLRVHQLFLSMVEEGSR
jgi:5'-phosphate synthase pdxT subunit